MCEAVAADRLAAGSVEGSAGASIAAEDIGARLWRCRRKSVALATDVSGDQFSRKPAISRDHVANWSASDAMRMKLSGRSSSSRSAVDTG